jgi:hypothetical protein
MKDIYPMMTPPVRNITKICRKILDCYCKLTRYESIQLHVCVKYTQVFLVLGALNLRILAKKSAFLYQFFIQRTSFHLKRSTSFVRSVLLEKKYTRLCSL